VNEIEFDIDLRSSPMDRLRLVGDAGENTYRLGSAGINPNAAETGKPDVDMFVKGVRQFVVDPREGDDHVSTAKSAATGAPLRWPLTTHLLATTC
jgi:hypothetical protein